MKCLPNRPTAFSLVEVTLALGVAAFCLLAIAGLLPTGMRVNRDSASRLAAASIAQAVVGDMQASITASKSTVLTETRLFHIPLPLNGTTTFFAGVNGQQSGTTNQDADGTATPTPIYRVSVYATPGSGKAATIVRILTTWPALADPTAAVVPTKFAGSLEVMTAIDVN